MKERYGVDWVRMPQRAGEGITELGRYHS
jgi:hypothetical protein